MRRELGLMHGPSQRSLPHAVHLHAIARPNAPALLVWSTIERERRTISYCELAAHVSAARQHVRHLVLQCPGRTTCAKERIAILSHNSAAYLVHSLACMSLCSISVHLNWRMAPPTLGEQLVGLDCALLLVSTTLEANGRQAATDAPACRVEVFGALGPPLALDAQERQRAEVEAELAAPDDVAVVFFTSGSTGKPKAIPHTHGTLLWWAHSYTAQLPSIFDAATPRERWGSLSFAPYFHVMGFVANTTLNLVQGAPAYVLASDQVLSARLLVEASLVLEPATLNTVPYIVEGLCGLLRDGDEPTRRVLSRLRLITYGGAALASHCAPVLRLNGITSACTYGQTETAGPCMLGEVSGDLNALRPIGGARFEIVQTAEAEADGGASAGDESGCETGTLVFHSMGCVARMRFQPGGALYTILGPNDAYNTRDQFRVVEIPSARAQGKWLLYQMREDDVLVHTSGEMTNPYPTEDKIKSGCPKEVKNVVMCGNGRPRPLLLIEICEGLDADAVGRLLCAVVAEVNAELAEYSKVKLDEAWVLQPPHSDPLPVSMKGNVIRAFAEKRCTALLEGVEHAPTLAVSASWADLISGFGDVMDSMSTTAEGARQSTLLRQSREIAVCGHGLFAVMYSVVSVHYTMHDGESRGGWAASPVWLSTLLRFPCHHYVMPLGFMLLAVTDSARFAPRSPSSSLASACAAGGSLFKSQILRPYAILLVFKAILAASKIFEWGLRDGAWPPMWFFFTAIVFRAVRLAAWMARVPEVGVAIGAVLLFLASGPPDLPTGVLRRCVWAHTIPHLPGEAPGTTSLHFASAADGSGGHSATPANTVHLWCSGPFPTEPPISDWVSFILTPYWWSGDQIHIYVNAYAPFYFAGPWLLARALHSSKRAPHEHDRVGSIVSRLRVRFVVALVSCCVFMLLRHAWEHGGMLGFADSSDCVALIEVDASWQEELFQRTRRQCCHADSLLLTLSELMQSALVVILLAVCPLLVFVTQPMGTGMSARLEHTAKAFLITLPLCVRFNVMNPAPWMASSWGSALLLDCARLIVVGAVCVAFVEQLPRTPTLLSQAGFSASLPIYVGHVLVYPIYRSIMDAVRLYLPWLANQYAWPFVDAASIALWVLVLALAWKDCGRWPRMLVEVAVAAYHDPKAVARAAITSIGAALKVECGTASRAAIASARPLAIGASALSISVLLLAVVAPAAWTDLVQKACSGTYGAKAAQDFEGHFTKKASRGPPMGTAPWTRSASSKTKEWVRSNKTKEFRAVTFGKILTNPPCSGCPHPQSNVSSLDGCRDLCGTFAGRGCTSYVYNTLQACYIKGRKPLFADDSPSFTGSSWAGVMTGDNYASAAAKLADVHLFVHVGAGQLPEMQRALNRSLRLFWPQPKLTIALDTGRRGPSWRASAKNWLSASWPFPTVYLCKDALDPTCSSVYADLSTPSRAKFVALVAPDTLFISAATRNVLFDVKTQTPYVIAQVGRPPAGSYWAKVPLETRRVLKAAAPWRGAGYAPVVIQRAHLQKLREYISAVHRRPFDAVWPPIAPNNTPRNVLDLIVNYLWLHHRQEYSWRLQRVSWTRREWTGIDPASAPVGGRNIFGVNSSEVRAAFST